MTPWLALSDNYLYDVSGCSSATAAKALRNATQDFCRRTHAWRLHLAPITTVAGQELYTVPVVAGQQLVKLVSARLDGHDIDPLLYEHAWSGARGVIMVNPTQVKVQPVPSAGSLALYASMQPTNDATGIDDMLYARYARTIALGAKVELFNASLKPYTDRESAGRAKIEYDEQIRQVIHDVARAHSSAPLRVRAQFL